MFPSSAINNWQTNHHITLKVQQRLYAGIKMGIFDKSNYIVINEQVLQCTAKVILLAKMIKLWTFYENVIHS